MSIFTHTLIYSLNKENVYKYINSFLKNNVSEDYCWSSTNVGDDVFLRTRSSRFHNEIVLSNINKQSIIEYIHSLCRFTAISNDLESTFKYLIIYNIHRLSYEQQLIIKALIERYTQYTLFILTSDNMIIDNRLLSILDVKRLTNTQNTFLLSDLSKELNELLHDVRDVRSFREYCYSLMVNNIPSLQILRIIQKYYLEKYPNNGHEIIHEIAQCQYSIIKSERIIYHFDRLYLRLMSHLNK